VRIDHPPLSAERGRADCDASSAGAAAGPEACRVRRQWTEAELRGLLNEPQPVRAEGDELTFVTEMDADSVSLQGGLQFPMSRVAGTNLWTITLRVQGARSAVVSYFFVPLSGGVPVGMSFTPRLWRGPDAPAALPRAATLQGRVVVDSLEAPLLRRPRHVGVYLPPERGGDPVVAVVYTGDGAAVGLAAAVDTLIVMGLLPRIMLVGVEADAPRRGEPRTGEDYRSREYLYLPGSDSTYFLAHERFVLEHVVPWAEREFGAPSTPARRGIAGFSNSAAMALDLGLRNPDVFGNVIALSPGGRVAALLPGTALPTATRFFLTGGRLEGAFHRKAVTWAGVFRGHGVVHTLREPVAGHDFEVWMEHFVEALGWAFGGDPLATRGGH
jgi:enterochelin esterase-like enzyme